MHIWNGLYGFSTDYPKVLLSEMNLSTISVKWGFIVLKLWIFTKHFTILKINNLIAQNHPDLLLIQLLEHLKNARLKRKQKLLLLLFATPRRR